MPKLGTIKGFEIEMWPVDRPTPYPKNARVISASAIGKVAASIQEFGWRQPIVVDEGGVIIMGHTRQLAARKLGLAEVPVHVARGLSPAKVRALRLADNRSHEESRWDLATLSAELIELKALDLDLSFTAFDKAELSKLLPDSGGLVDADEVPPVPEQPITKPGDLWLLGDHRLLCGDSTAAADVAGLLGAVKPHLMVTDPPYGVEYDPAWRLEAGVNKPWQTRAEGKVTNDDRVDWSEAWKLFPGSVAYVWHGWLHSSEVGRTLESVGFQLRAQIIWMKTSLVMGRGHYHWQHEPCWYAAKGTASWQGDRKQSTVWQIQNMHRTQGNVDDGKTSHSTQKPVECMRRPIENNSSPGQAVYEPFCGSGTTLIAAEMTGRICYAIEISPAYCDVIITRWENFTGRKAELCKR